MTYLRGSGMVAKGSRCLILWHRKGTIFVLNLAKSTNANEEQGFFIKFINQIRQGRVKKNSSRNAATPIGYNPRIVRGFDDTEPRGGACVDPPANPQYATINILIL
jgi:hypothetical protein